MPEAAAGGSPGSGGLELSCEHCGDAFAFSAAEQASFAERGFVRPKRCPACRRARRARARGELPPSSDAPVEVLCAACGASTQLPFRPRGERPVYCAECFRHR